MACSRGRGVASAHATHARSWSRLTRVRGQGISAACQARQRAGLTWNSGSAVLLERRSVTFYRPQHTWDVRRRCAELAASKRPAAVARAIADRTKCNELAAHARTRAAGGQGAKPWAAGTVACTHLLDVVGRDEDVTAQTSMQRGRSMRAWSLKRARRRGRVASCTLRLCSINAHARKHSCMSRGIQQPCVSGHGACGWLPAHPGMP